MPSSREREEVIVEDLGKRVDALELTLGAVLEGDGGVVDQFVRVVDSPNAFRAVKAAAHVAVYRRVVEALTKEGSEATFDSVRAHATRSALSVLDRLDSLGPMEAARAQAWKAVLDRMHWVDPS